MLNCVQDTIVQLKRLTFELSGNMALFDEWPIWNQLNV